MSTHFSPKITDGTPQNCVHFRYTCKRRLQDCKSTKSALMTAFSPRSKLPIDFLNFPKDCILHKIRHRGAFALLDQFLVNHLNSFTFKLHFPQGFILTAPTFSLTMLFIKLSYLLIISIFNTFPQGKGRFIVHRLTTSESSTI